MRKLAQNDSGTVISYRDHSAWAFFLPVIGVGCLALGIRLIGWDRQVFSDLVALQYFDKAGHVILFGCLSYFFHHLGRTKTTWPPVKVIGSSLFVVFLFGLLDETSQLWFENRQFERLDLLANVLGAGLVGPLGCLPDRVALRCGRWCSRLADRGGLMGGAVQRILEMKSAYQCRVSREGNSLMRSPGPSDGAIRILLIEDESRVVHQVSHHLRTINLSRGQQPMTMECADCLAKGVTMMEASQFDVILLDLSLPDGQGIRIFEKMARIAPLTPVVVLANGSCWDGLFGQNQDKIRHSLLKESLSSETLFWAIYDAYVRAVGEEAGERLGYRCYFGRISAANSFVKVGNQSTSSFQSVT